MRRVALPGLVVLGTALGACSLLTDLSGYSEDAGAPADASTDADGGTTAPPDGATGTDAAATPDAARFCVPNAHTFCADFEDGDVMTGWSRNEIAPEGSLSASTARFVSPSHALLTTMDRRAADAPPAYAQLTKTFDGWHKVAIDLDLFVEPPAWQLGDVNSGFFVVFFYADGVEFGVAMSLGELYITFGTPASSSPQDNKPLPFGSWVHLHAVVSPSALDATVGSVPFTSSWSPPAAAANARMSVQLGIAGYNRPAPAFRAFYDNVTVDIAP
jgi:hypothetical protein